MAAGRTRLAARGIAGELEARADAGDSRAACRLAVELLRCAQIEDFLSTATAEDGTGVFEQSSERDSRLDDADRWAHEQVWHIRTREQCRQLPQALHARSWDMLRGAALASEPEAMLRYAQGTALQTSRGFQLGHPGLDDWRREAQPMMERAFRAGHREAAMLLWAGHVFDNEPYAGLITNDRERALALHILSSLQRGVGMPPLERFNAAQIATAMRQAEAWHKTYFGGRTVAKPRDMGMISPLAQHDPGAAAHCE